MIKDIQYIRLQEVLSRCTRHPLMKDLTLEAGIQYALDFIRINGLPDLFENKEVIVPINCYRGTLPCDLVAVNQVMDTCSGICLRSTTDTFYPDGHEDLKYSTGPWIYGDELTFTTRNFIIYTSLKEGEVKVNYQAIPVDEDGYPLLIDNSVYLRALEAYIKKQVFTILFDTGKIQAAVLQNAQQEYAWAAGQLNSEFSIPSTSEMESIMRSWTTLVQRVTDFDRGFKRLGDREYLRKH